ncbi:MAG: hypothetical protein WKG07_47390 [Hymenobacter sp.]
MRAWLSEQLDLPEAELPPTVGFALFEAPLTFGPGVEAQLNHQAAAYDFQLLGGAAQLPVRLSQYRAAELAGLPAEELLEWGEYLAAEPYVSHTDGIPDNLFSFLTPKLRQLWRWLGAEDIPADLPYGGGPTPMPRCATSRSRCVFSSCARNCKPSCTSSARKPPPAKRHALRS